MSPIWGRLVSDSTFGLPTSSAHASIWPHTDVADTDRLDRLNWLERPCPSPEIGFTAQQSDYPPERRDDWVLGITKMDSHLDLAFLMRVRKSYARSTHRVN